MIRFVRIVRTSEADYDDYEQYFVQCEDENGHQWRYNSELVGYQEALAIMNSIKQSSTYMRD